MKNLKKRVERLERILKPVKRLQESRKLKGDSSTGSELSFEERQGIREFFESLEVRISRVLAEGIREGILDPSLKEEARKAIYAWIGEKFKKMREEREAAEKIIENSKSDAQN